MAKTRSSMRSTPSPPHPSETLDLGWWIRVVALFGIYTALVIVTTRDIALGEHNEVGLVPQFILTISYAVGPTLIGMYYVDTRRTAGAFLFMQIATCLMNFTTSVAWYRNPRELGLLPYIGHDILGEVPEVIHTSIFGKEIEFHAESMSDNLILTLLVLTIVQFSRDPDRGDIFRRFIMVYGLLEMMRTVTVLLTSLPDASAACRRLTPIGDLACGASSWKAMNNNETWSEILIHTGKILIPVHPVTCGDMIFSGHSNSAICLALTWHTYYKWVPAKVNIVKTFIWCLAVTACTLLVLTKVHYTLDVVLAMYFSITVWGTYHRLAIDVKMGHRFISVWWIDSVIIYPVMEFLELPLTGETVKKTKKARDEMNLFEIQMMGMQLDDEEDKKKRRRSSSSRNKIMRPISATDESYSEEKKEK
mmetsp:Transcript_9530/g.19396  ORF Transcript_9530/g.19396 Transcript_9530/m.19396 type:complete len:420 (-) Transcript_9530:69-1328(-)